MLVIQVQDTRGREWYWYKDLRVTPYPIKAGSNKKAGILRAIIRAIRYESLEGVPVYVEDTEETINPFMVKLVVLDFVVVRMKDGIPEPMYAYKNSEIAMNSINVEDDHWNVKVVGDTKFVFEGTQLKSGDTFFVIPTIKRD